MYKGGVTPTYAITTRQNNGTCEGHAWLRVYTPSGWTSWVSNPTEAKISSSGGHITRAQHKGCADCKVYSTELRDLD